MKNKMMDHLNESLVKMYLNFKRRKDAFVIDEKGMGTIEIVIIIAVLIGLAFLFRTFAVTFFEDLTQGIKENNQINDLFTSP